MGNPSGMQATRRGDAVGRRVAILAAAGTLLVVTAWFVLLGLALAALGFRLEGVDGVGFLLVLVLGGVGGAVSVALVVFLVVEARVGRRLVPLLGAFRRAETGDVLGRLTPSGDDELGDLERAFNAVQDRIADLTASSLHSDLMVKWAQRELRLKEEILAQSRSLTEVNEQLVRRVRESSDLLEIAEAAAATLDMDEMLDRLGRTLVATLHVEEVIVLLATPESGELSIQHSVGVRDRAVAEALLPGAEDSIVRRALDSGEIEYVPDIEMQPSLAVLRGRRRTGGSLVAVPVRGRGQSNGVIVLLHREAGAFQPEDLGFLKLVAHYMTLAVSNAVLYRQTRDQAIHDPLTGLYNRRFFMESYTVEWTLARRVGSPLSVLMIDVDWFKQFNDRYGHQVGDEVLRVVARVLKAVVRDVDVVGRYGGEEFIVALPGAALDGAMEVGEKLRAAVEGTAFPLAASGGFAHLTVSVGVASGHAGTPEDLIRAADLALLQAKSAGRNRIVPMRPAALGAVHSD